MKLSAEEKLMYQVMKAIYESGIPVSFKGSMVLKACLMEAGFTEDVRHTVDIDANWNTDNSPSAEHMVESIQHQRIIGNHFLDRCHVSIQVSHDLGHGNIHESRVQRAYERRRGDNNHWHP